MSEQRVSEWRPGIVLRIGVAGRDADERCPECERVHHPPPVAAQPPITTTGAAARPTYRPVSWPLPAAMGDGAHKAAGRWARSPDTRARLPVRCGTLRICDPG
jgi:hypothetical protein